jgi:hypothetical protein
MSAVSIARPRGLESIWGWLRYTGLAQSQARPVSFSVLDNSLDTCTNAWGLSRPQRGLMPAAGQVTDGQRHRGMQKEMREVGDPFPHGGI